MQKRRTKVARAAAATLFDSGAGIDAKDLDALIADLDDFLVHAQWRTSFAIGAAATAVQLYPFLTGRFSRFTALSPADRAEVLLALERSGSLGKAWAGLKLLLAMLWFDGPAGSRTLPEQIRRTKALEEPPDPLVTRLGPEGPIPVPRRFA
jgi:hypothetical protein